MEREGAGDNTNGTGRYWWIGLGGGAAVIGAVALLLTVLVGTVDQIERRVGRIWQAGKLIANNTVHVPLLVRTNQVVGDIQRTASDIERATARIERAVDSGS